MDGLTPLRVLLLEDQPDDAELTLAELRRAGFAAAGARVDTEPEFLAALDPDLDVVLADYSLPQFNTERALQLMQERGMDIPFIVVSGTIGEERAAAIMKEGASDYVLKDRIGRLGSAIRHALAQRALQQEKERAEAALAASEARFRTLIENASDIVTIVDADGIVQYASPAVERLLNYRAVEIVGSALTQLAHPEDMPAVQQMIDTALTIPDHRQTHEFRLRTRHVPWRPFEAIATNLVDDPGVAGIVVVARDLTERQQMDELRVIAAEERAHARLLEEQSTLRASFMAMVAHELGSRIAGMRRSADLLEIDPLSAVQRAALETIHTEGAALRHLLADAVAAATVERDDFAVFPHAVPIDNVLDAAASFARTLPGDHPLIVESDATGHVLADNERIDQVIRNLLGNAAKYARPGTSVTLRATRSGDRVRIEVADQGSGISPDDLPHIFDKFTRGQAATANKIPGVGLGLYLSRRIVQAHGSDLTVQSAPGQGATFGFDLEVTP